MPYQMYRVFCGAPGDLEQERQAFYQAVGDFNEARAMPQNILLVAVSLPDTTLDKRPYQAVLGENIRACRYYIQLLEDTWGPPQRNFERDHALALACADDPEMPMKEVAVFFKKPLLPHQVEEGVRELKASKQAQGTYAEFATAAELARLLEPLFERWLSTLAPAAASA